MTSYSAVERTVSVPLRTGVSGLMHAIREILKKPRVQSILIDSKARITYTCYVPDDMHDDNLGVNFEELEPSYIVQHSDIREIQNPSRNGAAAIGQMFAAVASDHLHPLAFVSGADTNLWEWYRLTSGVDMRRSDSMYGLPIYLDRAYEDDLLLLCAGYGRDAGFVDTQATYKMYMDIDVGPVTSVEVI